MFRINTRKHRQHDREHGKTQVFQGKFSGTGKYKGEEENEIHFKTIKF